MTDQEMKEFTELRMRTRVNALLAKHGIHLPLYRESFYNNLVAAAEILSRKELEQMLLDGF